MTLSRRAFVAALVVAPVADAGKRAAPSMLLVGDSLAYQLGPRLAKALPSGQSLALDGRGGTSARQWLRLGWFSRALQRHESAQLVLVSLGVNCIRSERKALRDDIAALRELASGRRCVWLLPPPLRFSTEYIGAAVSGEVFYPGELPLEADGVHPTHVGHERWAQMLVKRYA